MRLRIRALAGDDGSFPSITVQDQQSGKSVTLTQEKPTLIFDMASGTVTVNGGGTMVKQRSARKTAAKKTAKPKPAAAKP